MIKKQSVLMLISKNVSTLKYAIKAENKWKPQGSGFKAFIDWEVHTSLDKGKNW